MPAAPPHPAWIRDGDRDVRSFVGSALRRVRQRRELSSDDLAARLNVSVSTLLRWETNAARPSPRHLRALSEVLGLLPTELVRGSGSPTLRQLRQDIHALTITEAAEKSGLTASALDRLERGQTHILKAATLAGLSCAYSCAPRLIQDAHALTMQHRRQQAVTIPSRAVTFSTDYPQLGSSDCPGFMSRA